MELSEVLESIKDIALYIFISIYLIFKILKYFVSRERLKVKKESLSVFGSIDTTPSLSVKPILDEHAKLLDSPVQSLKASEFKGNVNNHED